MMRTAGLGSLAGIKSVHHQIEKMGLCLEISSRKYLDVAYEGFQD